MSGKATSTGRSRLWWARLLLCIVLDLADFVIGRILGFGIAMDLALTVVAVGLFGWRGLVHLWEVAEPTEQIDAFVPTLTLLALSAPGPGDRRP